MKKTLRIKLFSHFLLIVLSLLYVFPLFWLISTSLKSSEQIYSPQIIWFPVPFHLPNYVQAIKFVNLFNAFINTSFICIVNILGVLFSSSLAAYAFSAMKWKFRDLFFYLTISSMMLPEMVTLVPQFILLEKLGFYGTYFPLVAPYFFGNAFYIFLIRQFFLTIPKELGEAASVDGCSHFDIFFKIYIPLSVPVLSVVSLFQFLISWNDLIRPSVYLINENQYTLSLALQQFKAQHGGTEWSLLMAATTLIILPVIIVFFLAQSTFVKGIAMSGLKD